MSAAQHMPGRSGFDEARRAIAEGRATAHAHWTLLSNEQDRASFALKPQPWEGSGEYQRVTYGDELGRYVRLPFGESLPIAKATGSAA